MKSALQAPAAASTAPAPCTPSGASAHDGSTPACPSRPVVHVDSGALEALKWFALVCMTVDHINTFVLGSTQPWLFNVGRLALPIFSFVLAYNLVRPLALEPSNFRRLATRLALVALVATPPHAALAFQTWGLAWPLNVLWALLASAWIVRWIDQGTRRSHGFAAITFVLAGSSVEFWWPALLLVIGPWMVLRGHMIGAGMLATGLGLAGLNTINGNFWALAALLPIAAALYVGPALPRLRWAFYAYYPAHLAVLLLMSSPAHGLLAHAISRGAT